MSERNARLLAALSHQWSGIVFLALVTVAFASFFVGRARARAIAAADPTSTRILTGVRIAVNTVLGLTIATQVVAFFHVGCAYLVQNEHRCYANVKQLALAVLMYKQDYNERMPLAANWSEAVAPYVHSSSDIWQCPAGLSPASYGMNAQVGNVADDKVDAPAATVLLFEANAPKRSFAGGPHDVAAERHSGGSNFGYCDGHVRRSNSGNLAQLNWSPRAAAGAENEGKTNHR